jgi:NADH-quinone oxidoreductase subunit F
VARNIDGRTICAFGEACSWPTESFVAKFRKELISDTKPELDAAIVNPETRWPPPICQNRTLTVFLPFS